MSNCVWFIFIVGVVSNIVAANVSADVKKDIQLEKVIESIAVPESPAFSILGVTPDKVTRPGNGRELAVALLQGVDDNGNFQNGLAIDWAPYLLVFGKNLTLTEYKRSSMKRFLTHIQLSIGTAKGSDVNDKSGKIATGLRATVFDHGDPRMDTELDSCIGHIQESILAKYGPISPNLTDSEKTAIKSLIETETEEALKTFRDRHSRASMVKPALDVGLSPLWISEDGQTKNLKGSGLAAWSSFKFGFDDFLVNTSIQYKSKDLQPDPEKVGEFIEGRGLTTGTKARFGRPLFGGFVQTVYTSFDPKGRKRDDQFLYSIGGEIKIADNIWLEANVGGTSGKEGNNYGFVSTQFKWSISETSALK